VYLAAKTPTDEPFTDPRLVVDVSRLFRAFFMRMAEPAALHQLICDGAGKPANYRIVEVNPQYERLLGRKREQLVGKLADEAYETRQPPHLAVYGQVALEGQPYRLEEYCAALGRHYEVSIAAMGSGLFSTILTDVTERRRQATASREAEWFLERSQIVGQLGSYRFDVASGNWASSPGLDEVFGILPTFERSVAGWLALVHPDDRESMAGYLTEHVLEQGHPFDRRYRILRQDNGELRWVHGRGELETDAAGVPLFMIGTIQDITESVEREQVLRSKSEELDRIFSLTLDMLCIATTDGRLLRVNAAWERVLGWSVEELEGTLYTAFIHTDDLAATRQAMHELASGRDVIDVTNRCLCKDGSWRVIEWRSAPAGGVIYAAARDVSERERNKAERQRLEQQLLQSQRMESVGRLAGGVAHDFNNLLTIILSCTDELVRLARDDEARSLLSDVEQASQRAAELTHQLLAFSRQQVLHPRVLDLNQVVLGVSRMLRRMLGETVELVSIPGPEVQRVFADPGQLEQIIVNLAVNARDAMPGGGQLTLETYNQPVERAATVGARELPLGSYVVLEVHDTGVGMDESTRARIFEPFFTTKGERGTGLGLATVYGIVEQSGGHITVTSQPGVGTTFKVYLPTADVRAASATPAVVRGMRLAGHETVLLVEDDAPVRMVLKRALTGAGYQVLEAANADEASCTSAARRGSVDVLLTDVVMPGKTGRQLAEHLTSKRPSLRVLYMSGYAPGMALSSVALEEGSAFLQKPIRPLQLLSKLRELLDAPQLVKEQRSQ
jgi:two-component system, cell cycle sensor histidine kinase and response regulator CckA